MKFDPLSARFPSRRMVTYAKNGMVCTSQPLAAGAGLDMLKQGGNAVDAAVAAAIALTVVEPTSNGIGGDCFAIVWMRDAIFGLNASGPAPDALSIETLEAAGYPGIPFRGWVPITVPGQPAGWKALSERFGKLPFPALFAPAIRYASEGYPVSPVVSRGWANAFREFSGLGGDAFRPWFECFAPGGAAPKAGEIFRSQAMADTLSLLAETGCEAFYRGELAAKAAVSAERGGGYLKADDLGRFSPEWVTPLSVNYRGYDVYELPPNGQGLVALMALGMLRHFDLGSAGGGRSVHLQAEAVKLAFADGFRTIGDPRFSDAPIDLLLSDGYLKSRAATITGQARQPSPGSPESGGTVYLAAADGMGNMVSYIQSNFRGFGSGIVLPDTGVALHNRGYGFSLDRSSPNCLMPGKRPYHTIIPGFLAKSGRAVGPFGVMGAFMQPQGHLQVIVNAVDYHMNPQQALDAPRWQWVSDKTVETEHGISPDTVRLLADAGHTVRYSTDTDSFGRGQIIWRSDDGVLCGATDPRADGCAAAW